jgi:glycosyltransferase involved in cell wall biosynthesis
MSEMMAAGEEASTVTDFSVVIPTHNRSGWLRQSLRAVLAQKDVILEVIVVDDGSDDDTSAVVADVGGSRVRLLRHDRPQGLSVSRNHGAEEARGEWLAFIDDDDLWSPHKLRRQLHVGNTTGRTWVYTGSVNIDDSLRILGGRPPPPPDDVMRLITRGNPIPGSASSVALRRAEFHRVGPFDVDLQSAEDWEMWIRLAKHGAPAWVPEPLVALRLLSTNMSLDVAAILDSVASIERRHGIDTPRGPLYRWIAASCLRTGQRIEWLKYLSLAAVRGEPLGAAEDVLIAVRGRLDRYLARPPRSLAQLPHPEWTARAQGWLEDFRLASHSA